MKPVSKQAEVVFRAAMARMVDNECKIDNNPGLYMALCVERIGRCDKGDLISFAHYGEQNGDAMRDPDIVMIDAPGFGLFPVSYRNDYLGIDQEIIVIEGGRVTGYRPRQYESCRSFCATWAQNIRDQQGV